MFFTNNSTYPIGLDISDLSLKLIQLNKSGHKIKIQALAKTNLPKGWMENGEIKNEKGFANAINKLINNPDYGKVSSEEVIACLPETKTFIKLIEVERTANPLSDIIATEMEKYIPMSINEIYYDWQVMEEYSDKQYVLIGATPKNIVDQYTLLLDKAKLSIVALEIEPVAICRSLLAEESNTYTEKGNINYGIIDIGAKRTSMIIYAKNSILFTFSMPISGEEVTKKIAEALKINISQAEKAKIICGFDESKAEGIIKNILSQTINDLVKRIKEALAFYNQHFPGYGQINKILLCGGGANIKSLGKIITKETSIETTVGDVLINLKNAHKQLHHILTEKHTLNITLSKKEKDKIISKTQSAWSTFATAIGLALRGIFIDEL